MSEDQYTQLLSKMDSQFTTMFKYMDGRFSSLEESMAKQNTRLDSLDTKMSETQREVANLREDVDVLRVRVDGIHEDMTKRFDTAEQVQNEILNAIEERFNESDTRHDRHDAQITQLAKHTGLKLAA
ncbi:MAG: hypothetical protein KC435_14335 [Thermomicrobiales bacterium]|nr:hypothetical protein [Thermomicrobiales bacterium]